MSFDLLVVDADTPILLPIYNMEGLGVYLQNLDDVHIHHAFGEKAKITRLNNHLYLQCNTNITSHFTFSKLKRLHRCFGDLPADKLVNFLNRAEMSTITPDTR